MLYKLKEMKYVEKITKEMERLGFFDNKGKIKQLKAI